MYATQDWRDNDVETPLSAARMTHIEQGIAGIDRDYQALADRVGELESEPTSSGIVVVTSPEQEEALPVGTLFVRDYQTPTGPTIDIVGTDTGNVNALSFTPVVEGAMPGDKMVIAVNAKAVSGSTLTTPAGFTALVDGYWAGTQQSWVLVGDYADDLTVTASAEAEVAWVAVAVRGASSATAGAVKDRVTEPVEDMTVTAPDVSGDLRVGFAFERTTAAETADQITVSEGWEKLAVAEQGVNVQTVVAATGGAGDLTVTYPNVQAANGTGVMVGFHA